MPRNWLRKWPQALIVILGLYICFHAVNGQQGLWGWMEDRHRIETLRSQIHARQAERLELETQIARLKDAHPDLDFIEERAREILWLNKANELRIRLDDNVRADNVPPEVQ